MSTPDHTNTPHTPTAPVVPTWTWVPIRSLGPRHRDRILTHLLALDPSDRYLRFGYAATDAQISKYVDMLDFEQDEVFGIFSRRLELIAMAHLAHSVSGTGHNAAPVSEFGVSVLKQARARGFGRRLFEHAMLHARNRGVETLLIHALSENTAMLKIARNAGAKVVREGSESDAWLKLPPDSLASHMGELVEHRAAELDYRLKVHARQVGGLLDAITEVKASLNKASHVAEE
ncbi:GNAT family N-acetyltransferase [Rhizobacter sp. Root404]|jgi:GNAT superfamily N-acetyltransferase|uniref:GNAT family N-acetyltransferase n=1 Tax=Rhizobacter sp. Root404 TaxID=1736528 RepID=UPI000701B08F|nr:GNAT family N-acetyltransferase [Rhizobacter sp. Root404]KQW40043.1 GCN5 family acetyltransferase [Rhizobacter sp. Root404]